MATIDVSPSLVRQNPPPPLLPPSPCHKNMYIVQIYYLFIYFFKYYIPYKKVMDEIYPKFLILIQTSLTSYGESGYISLYVLYVENNVYANFL